MNGAARRHSSLRYRDEEKMKSLAIPVLAVVLSVVSVAFTLTAPFKLKGQFGFLFMHFFYFGLWLGILSLFIDLDVRLTRLEFTADEASTGGFALAGLLGVIWVVLLIIRALKRRWIH